MFLAFSWLRWPRIGKRHAWTVEFITGSAFTTDGAESFVCYLVTRNNNVTCGITTLCHFLPVPFKAFQGGMR